MFIFVYVLVEVFLPPPHILIVKCLFKVFSQSSHKFTLFTLKDILRPGPRYWKKINTAFIKREFSNLVKDRVIMQGQLFQRCTHLLYCSLLSLGGNVNTRRMSQPDMETIFFIKKNQWNILVIENYYVKYIKYQN